MMVSHAKINLGESTGSIHLIEQILNLGQGILIFDGYFVELLVIHT
jgi:hypothetical protein